ncbi:MAG: cupredoxin domain-containing protein [Dehalococcoidia bacterium]
MQLRRWGVVAIGSIALASAALVGCGDDDDDDIDDVEGATEIGGSPAGETATGTGGGDDPAGEVPAGAALIEQEDLEFTPDELEVTSEESVYFRSKDAALHTVNVNGENESGDMREGDVFEWEPPTTGEFDITCDFHPDMQATVTVN